MIDLEELYRRLGGDCKSVLQRIPSEAMVCKFVHKYADDPTYSQRQPAPLPAAGCRWGWGCSK